MQNTEDFAVIEAVKAGDIQAFETLVRKYHHHLLNFIFQIIRDDNIIEDIGQEVFLSVYKTLSQFDENRGVPFSAWLFIIARNKCITELRKRKTSEFVPIIDELPASDSISPEILYQKKERRRAIEKALEKLDEPLKQVIIESLNGKTIKEISRACKLPDNTVKVRMFRARKKLWHLLGDL